jgi:hypothetical protein
VESGYQVKTSERLECGVTCSVEFSDSVIRRVSGQYIYSPIQILYIVTNIRDNIATCMSDYRRGLDW